MIYRKFKNSDKPRSVIGFGGMRFSAEEYKKDITPCAELVRYAFSKGINNFDTAKYYCDDYSEKIMGEAFKTMPRDKFVISTKINSDMGKDANSCYDYIRRALDVMHLDKLDNIYAWCIKTKDEYEDIFSSGRYDGFLRAQSEGLCDTISFSTHMCGEDIASVAADERFSGTLLGCNILNFKYRQAGVEALAREGKGISIMNPMGGGLISQNTDVFDCIRRGNDGVKLTALKFLTSQPYITSVLCGFSSMKEVDENVKAAKDLYEMDESFFDVNLGTGESNSLCTSCGYCNHCPKGIPCHQFMFSYDRKILGKGDKAVLSSLDDHFGVSKDLAKECIACGKCESLCTQKLPIIKRMKEIAEME